MEYKTLLNNEILFGNSILEWIPHPEGIFGSIFKAISVFCHYTGGITFFVFLLPFVYLCYSKKLGIKLGVAILSSGIINGLAKFYFESPRPSGLPPERFFDLISAAEEKAFGFPSGHAHVAILLWGILFLHFQNRMLKSFSFFMILAVPFSRMYMGVHYPGDVIGGFLMGLVSLFIIEGLFRFSPDFPSLGLVNKERQASLSRSISLALVAITLPITLISRDPMTEIHSHSLNSVISAGGSIAGFFSGILYLKYKFGENYFLWGHVKSISSFLVRASFISMGIFLFYFLLGALSKKYFHDDVLARYVRYFLLNFFLVCIIPYLLHKLAVGRFMRT